MNALRGFHFVILRLSFSVLLYLSGITIVTAIDDEIGAGIPHHVRHVKTYTSQSGEFEIVVDPTHLNACYDANYIAIRNSDNTWATQLPFTLWDARVTDDGHVVGYGYTQGLEGIFHKSDDPRPGHLIVAIIDPGGSVLMKERIQRVPSDFLHGSPTPIVQDIKLGHLQKSFLLRVDDADNNRNEEHWWFYDIHPAKRRKEVGTQFCQSDGSDHRTILHVGSISNSPLWIVQVQTILNGDMGVEFIVCDSGGEIVWKLAAPVDYEVDDDELEDKLLYQMRQRGAILENKEANQFSFQLVKSEARVTFRVERESDGQWKVVEVGRQRRVYEADQRANERRDKPSTFSMPLIGELKLTKSVEPLHPVRDIACGFAIDPSGHFAFIRHSENAYEFVAVDTDGKQLEAFDLEIEIPKGFLLNGIVSIGGGHFVTTASSWQIDSQAMGWNIDINARTAKRLANFRSPSIDCLVGMTNERFAVLATEQSKNTMTPQLQICDSTGEQLSLIDGGYNSYPQTLFSPEAIAVNSAGELCVLDVIRKEIVVYSDDVRYRRTLNLPELWGYEPNYPSGLFATRDGGLIVYDFHGRHPLVQMTASGKPMKVINPRSAEDRKTLFCGESLRVTPDGNIWIVEGPEIVRLGEKGIVDKRLGVPANPHSLDEIDAIHIDRQGQIFAQASRTGAIHICDLSGQTKHVLFHDRLLDHAYSRNAINVTGEKELAICVNDDSLLFFDWEGKLKAELTPPGTPAYYQQTNDVFLCSDITVLLVVSRDGTIRQRIRRHADRTWLEKIESVAIGKDGSFAVLTRHTDVDRSWKVSIFEADFSPRCTVDHDRYVYGLDYDGTYLALAVQDGLLFFNGEGQSLGHFPAYEDLEKTQGFCFYPYLVDARGELILVEASSDPRIRRYDLTSLRTRKTRD
ncbi:MAG: hypothetical protein AAGG48_10890 [Planctomycetota bacterium]